MRKFSLHINLFVLRSIKPLCDVKLLQLQVDITDDLIYPTYNIYFEYLSILLILDKNLREVTEILKVIDANNSALT